MKIENHEPVTGKKNTGDRKRVHMMEIQHVEHIKIMLLLQQNKLHRKRTGAIEKENARIYRGT